MPVNKEYLLERIITIQDIVLEHHARGIPQIKVYREIIYPRFFISLPTFKNYMCRNAKKELRELMKYNR